MQGSGPKDRSSAISRLGDTRFDLLVIGGGITGAGIALDAATRGLTVALCDKGDFASGTSSKSSKLVHGGLRYLEQKDFKLIHEAVNERDLLRRIAPHLVRPIPFVWPRWAGASTKAGIGLSIYDSMAGTKGVGRHRSLDAEEVAKLMPSTHKSTGAYLYYDSQTDDVRLTLAVLRTARRAGAVICNYAGVTDLLEIGGRVVGAVVTDEKSGTSFEVRATDVVNATGVWADTLTTKESPEVAPRLRPSKGVHIVLPGSLLPLSAAVIIPTSDRRLIFTIPWRSSVIVGTTDDEYTGPLDRPTVEEKEIQHLLDAVRTAFDVDVAASDICGAYAGLRPLLASGSTEGTRDLSRRHAVFRGPKGLITITGGKLTTFRSMAEEAVDLVTKRQGRPVRCVTSSLRVGVSDLDRLRDRVAQKVTELQLGSDTADSLVMSYGDEALDVLELARTTGTATPIVEGLPYIEAEITWAVREEMATSWSDVLSRRTRLALEDPTFGSSSRERIASLMEAAGADPGPFEGFIDEVLTERGTTAPIG